MQAVRLIPTFAKSSLLNSSLYFCISCFSKRLLTFTLSGLKYRSTFGSLSSVSDRGFLPPTCPCLPLPGPFNKSQRSSAVTLPFVTVSVAGIVSVLGMFPATGRDAGVVVDKSVTGVVVVVVCVSEMVVVLTSGLEGGVKVKGGVVAVVVDVVVFVFVVVVVVVVAVVVVCGGS